jgi:molybdopterin-guanine dinucleotide biosynthesis protein A
MQAGCSGAILAGGQNSRFSGQNKSFLPIGTKPMIERLMECFDQLFDEIILVTNDPEAYLDWNVKIVTDIYPIRASLNGIHTGLVYASHPYTFFSACDTPFLSAEVVETIVATIDARTDIVIPQTDKGYEPLCAVYSKACLKPIERLLKQHRFQIQKLFGSVRVKTIAAARFRGIDPQLLSFFNINTPQDLQHAEMMLSSMND